MEERTRRILYLSFTVEGTVTHSPERTCTWLLYFFSGVMIGLPAICRWVFLTLSRPNLNHGSSGIDIANHNAITEGHLQPLFLAARPHLVIHNLPFSLPRDFWLFLFLFALFLQGRILQGRLFPEGTVIEKRHFLVL